MPRVIRVFPRRTNATPDDELAFVGDPGLWPQADKISISVTFSWDLPEAERLRKLWARIAPTEIGGPATGMAGEDFTPGLYLKHGYTITSRGCPNRCWFCSVWKRDGDVRELPIRDGWNILDDNLLACSESHIRAVFAMLSRQPQSPQFTGGLEAKRLKPWIADELRKLSPESLFFANDTADDLEPLHEAGKMLFAAGFPRGKHVGNLLVGSKLRCYVLCGFPKDSFEAAERRMNDTLNAGFIPMAMVYRDKNGSKSPLWSTFQRLWTRPAIICKAPPRDEPELGLDY